MTGGTGKADKLKAFRELFRRLVAITPPPLGVGPEAAPRKA